MMQSGEARFPTSAPACSRRGESLKARQALAGTRPFPYQWRLLGDD
jgi:hypothetical protein